jgi:hypothetical protein
MQSSTYKDIIDSKIAEWQSSIKKLQEDLAKSDSDTQAQLSSKAEQLKSAIDAAIVQLHDLDEQENVGNTMETKDKILEVFDSIDKEFKGFDEQAPFML